jgi:hypothetical protein
MCINRGSEQRMWVWSSAKMSIEISKRQKDLEENFVDDQAPWILNANPDLKRFLRSRSREIDFKQGGTSISIKHPDLISRS